MGERDRIGELEDRVTAVRDDLARMLEQAKALLAERMPDTALRLVG